YRRLAMVMQLERPPKIGNRVRDQMVVHFTGTKLSLDEETLQHVRDPLLALAEEPSEADVLLDFGNVEYVSSALLDTLVRLHKRLLAVDRQLSVGNLDPQVFGVFAITRLDTLLDLHQAGSNGEPEFEPGANGVLVVDDEAAVLNVLAIGLRRLGYPVFLA